MIHVVIQAPDGLSIELEGDEGESVMLLAVRQGVDGILAECGGSAACATCHVYVDETYAEKLPAPTEQEAQMLEFVAAERRPNSRLACQIPLSGAVDGLRIEIPDRQI